MEITANRLARHERGKCARLCGLDLVLAVPELRGDPRQLQGSVNLFLGRRHERTAVAAIETLRFERPVPGSSQALKRFEMRRTSGKVKERGPRLRRQW